MSERILRNLKVRGLGTDIGQEAFLKRLRLSLTISSLAIVMLGILVLGTSCNEYSFSDSDKKAIHDIAFADSTIKELTTGREYTEKWLGTGMSDDMQTKLAGIIEITFAQPFYADRDWPGTERHEIRDPVSKKVTGYAYSKEINHIAKTVKKLEVVVYVFAREPLVTIRPIAEGE